MNEKSKTNKKEKSGIVTCPVCKTTVRYKKGEKYICPNCSAPFYDSKTVVKSSSVKVFSVLSVLIGLSGCIFGILCIVRWTVGEGDGAGAQSQSELLVIGYGAIWLSVVICMVLFSLSKIVDKSNVQRYYATARAKRTRREKVQAKAKAERIKNAQAKSGSGEVAEIFDFISKDDASEIVGILKDEKPQTTAFILGNMDENVAGDILIEFPLEKQKDVIRELVKLTSMDSDVAQELIDSLKQRLGIKEEKRSIEFSGIESAVGLLNTFSKYVQDQILQLLAEDDPNLSNELECELFRFGSLERLSDKNLAEVLQYISPRIIAYAVEGSSESLTDKILRNLSVTKQALVKKTIRDMPDKLSIRDIESAQQDVLNLTQKMAEGGEISFDDGYLS